MVVPKETPTKKTSRVKAAVEEVSEVEDQTIKVDHKGEAP